MSKTAKLSRTNLTSHRLKRVVQRFAINVSRSLNITEYERIEDSQSEREIIVLFKKMLNRADSELLISPISQKYYVKNDAKNLLIILNHNEVVIINHVFGYNIRVSQRSHKNLYDSFRLEVERRRAEMEESFKKNIKNSINSMIDEMTEPTK
jgi:hypothetical protein